MAKFDVGDTVKVIATYDCFSGLVGEVVSIDSDPEFPYRVQFAEERNELRQGVYPDDELELVATATATTVASGRVTFDALAVCAPIVVGDKRLDEVLREYADSGEDVEIVVRRKERG